MASSRSSEHRRQHASSISSTTSTPASAGPRRITLTIPPLKLKLSSSSHSAVVTPSNDVQTPISTTANIKQTPKIKIKPRASFVEPDSSLVESPVQRVSLPPPPPPPPKATPLLPPPKPKVPRPIKLRPLKEVLSKLIAQIKKKDAYAFFLNPVDPDSVSGYSDVVKTPMDFGTMSTKVETGKYRSLEQFKDDFLLVISNAKAFNPPLTLYHSEATRLEAFGLEHISRASAHVIEYETDWTIDVVADGEPVASTSELPANVAGNSISAVKLEDNAVQRARSPSVISSVPGANAPAEKTRRSRSKKITAVTESWEKDGHLPGHKDGLGTFPPRSDLSELMFELKLRGKRFRTKKERLRREKEGPPIAPDGSLNYLEMEHPFSVLQQLVPDPPSLPLLAPLIDMQSETSESVEATPAPKEASQPPEEKDNIELERMRPVRGPTFLPLPALSSILADAGKNIPPNHSTALSTIGKKKLKHWSITRNPPRNRARDIDDNEDSTGAHLTKRRRVAEAMDYGSFAQLTGLIAAENGILADDFDETFGTEEKFMDHLKYSLEKHASWAEMPDKMDIDGEKTLDLQPVVESDEYIRDVVYGGVDGLAYVRSLAEFVSPFDDNRGKQGGLGMPLAQWVETHIVNPLTYGYHSVLRDVAQSLTGRTKHVPEQVKEYLELANEDKSLLREEFRALAELCSPELKIDIAALLRAPNELFAAENEWSGVEYKARRELARQEAESRRANDSVGGKGDEPATSAPGHVAQDSTPLVSQGSASDTADVIEHALDTGAQAILELVRRLKEGDGIKFTAENTSEDEDALVRRTRLNLIAIAKRAPIDRIAHLPPELVPSHIRHIVPTLST